jgi:hypothetical protein
MAGADYANVCRLDTCSGEETVAVDLGEQFDVVMLGGASLPLFASRGRKAECGDPSLRSG